MLALGMMGFMLGVAIIGVSLLLIGLILLQKNRGAGLSGAFGGVGGHSAFGTKTGDFLTWITVGLVSVFLLLNIMANYVFVPEKPIAPSAAKLLPDSGESAESAAPDTPTPVTPVNAPPTSN